MHACMHTLQMAKIGLNPQNLIILHTEECKRLKKTKSESKEVKNLGGGDSHIKVRGEGWDGSI